MKELTTFEGVHCANCTTPMQGEYCHHCGQSIHSVLKPVHGLFEEFFETVLHIDGRIFHTLPPLMLKPGFLTLEYFSGRRVRYIAPFRLMFITCLLSFFVMHLAADLMTYRIDHKHQQAVLTGQASDFSDDETPADVQKDLSKNLAMLDATRTENAGAGGNPAIVAEVDRMEQKYRDDAKHRLAEVAASSSSAAAVASSVATGAHTEQSDDEHEKPIKPIQISWLPDFANRRLTATAQHMQENIQALFHGNAGQRQEARDRLITNVFSALPETMLVLIPAFALLLTLIYIFKRRLYMEHLIVALHSHAFIFASLLLITLAGMLSTWLKPHAAWVGVAMGLVQTVFFLWIPIYLLLMQKRIYRQGWVMTVVKFGFVGWLYSWLFGLALGTAAILGLAH
ncbi:DUF3667 domain-containing protein [Dyella psychrodurans]|uniref:DUF3667 domain-containing protein n=1 Tax=Dyella psychrodurans TaxID=1927960 RepID=A0A370X4N0_9GAMM|nr:DUF3667 domain-containing protein [Dyella psychrodurans]RDS83292.1 DUF3667 domain-containing protein [Dyella psychrodurans]